MHLITWSKRAQNFEIAKNLGRFGLNFGTNDIFCHNFGLTMNFIRILLICGTHLLDQSRSNPDVTRANDCVISHDCAISHDNYAISYSLFLVKKIDV